MGKIGAQDAAAALVYQIANGSKQRGGGRADGQHGQAAHKRGQIEQHQIRKARERAHDPRIRIEKTHHDLTASQPCQATGCAASGSAAHGGFWQQGESGAGILAEREEMQAPERSDYRSGSQRQLHLR